MAAALYRQLIFSYGGLMKRFGPLLLIFALSLPLTAHADEATRRTKAKEMLLLLKLDHFMEQMVDNVTKQVKALTPQAAGIPDTPENQAKVKDYQQKVLAVITNQMNWSAMEPEFADLYAKSFTDEQLDAILAFYKSPAGTTMVEKLPLLTNQGMQLAQQRMVAIQPQLKQTRDDFMKSVAPASGPAAAPAPAAAKPQGTSTSTHKQ
jgi:hypothetical protein